MEGADLELFEQSLRHATQSHTGASLDAALEELGWRDALALNPGAAIAILFELQGSANVCSSALDEVLLSGLGFAAVIPLASLTVRPMRGIDACYGLVKVAGEAAPVAVEQADWRRSRGARSAPPLATS